jgi:hypothetical protein
LPTARLIDEDGLQRVCNHRFFFECENLKKQEAQKKVFKNLDFSTDEKEASVSSKSKKFLQP